MRCRFCHNPDTWNISDAEYELSPIECLGKMTRNLPFYKTGGLTVSGGEPLMQIPFLCELFTLAKECGIHTAIDTSGYGFGTLYGTAELDKLLSLTDLVMLDIKHIDPEKHKALTGMDNKNILAFAKFLEEKNVQLWIRHIIVKGYTDSKNDLILLGKFIGKLRNLKALDVLPYHTMGVSKYKELNIPYPLEGIEALPLSDAVSAKEHILSGIREVRGI
jgi:pyruvate formate lyase activating enzyme